MNVSFIWWISFFFHVFPTFQFLSFSFIVLCFSYSCLPLVILLLWLLLSFPCEYKLSFGESPFPIICFHAFLFMSFFFLSFLWVSQVKLRFLWWISNNKTQWFILHYCCELKRIRETSRILSLMNRICCFYWVFCRVKSDYVFFFYLTHLRNEKVYIFFVCLFRGVFIC